MLKRLWEDGIGKLLLALVVGLVVLPTAIVLTPSQYQGWVLLGGIFTAFIGFDSLRFSKKCQKCRKVYEAGDIHCRHCGAKLRQGGKS